MVELFFPNAVREEKDLYGRGKELDRINQTFLARQRAPLVILGERRIGKTSLQNVALKQLEQSNAIPFSPIRVEPRGITTSTQLAQAILQQISRRLGKVWSMPEGSGLQTLDWFETEFEHLVNRTTDHDFVLCIDEFDEILRSLNDAEALTLEGLLLHVSEKTDLPLFFFFTISRLPEAVRTRAPSPLITKSQLIHLSPLTFDSHEEMVRAILNAHLDWQRGQTEWLYQLSGGHPYFTKLLLSNLLDTQEPGEHNATVTQVVLDKALNDALADPRGIFAIENLYRVHFSDAEKELVLVLAERGGAIRRQELEAAGSAWLATAKQLTSRHYLLQKEEGFDFQIGFLRSWFRNWILFEKEREERSALMNHLHSQPAEIEVDDRLKQVKAGGQKIRLSSQDYRIMYCLAERADQLVTKQVLAERVWNTAAVSDEMIDTAIYRLRKKLGVHGQDIETIQGYGYILHRAVLRNNS